MFSPVGRAHPHYDYNAGGAPRRSSVLNDTITAIAVSVLAMMGSNTLQGSAPEFSALLRLVPVVAGGLWLLRRFSSNDPASGCQPVYASPRRSRFTFNPFNWFSTASYTRPAPAYNRPLTPVYIPAMPVRHAPQNGPLPVHANVRQATYVPQAAHHHLLPPTRQAPPTRTTRPPVYNPPAAHHPLPVTRHVRATQPPVYVPPAAAAHPLPVARQAPTYGEMNVTRAGKPLFNLPTHR